MKVVICDHEFATIEPEKAALKNVPNLELIDGFCTTKEEVMKLTRDADGVINQWNYITEEVINNMQNCKVISTYGIGVDKIDIKAAAKKGIYVCNVPTYCIREVATHAFTMILALAKQIFPLDHNIRIGKYGFKYLDKKLYRPQGQTVGLVGFGKIPSTLAKQVQSALDMKVIAYDPYITAEAAAAAGVRKVDLETLMKESDFVSIHVPLTDDTRYMIDEKMLRLMKPTAYLVNAGRGAIVKEADLIKVLKDRAIAGAAIDVFEVEPIQPNDPLLELDNVFVTPHSAWYNEDSRFDLQTGAAENVARILAGGEPVNAVNLKLIQEYKAGK